MLILAATPIGNLEDASPRLLRTLEEADCLFAEDTRQTAKLIRHFELATPAPEAFHEHSPPQVLARILTALKAEKKVVYVTDAGMPAVSDPGFELVRAAREAQVEVDVIPGPSAVLNALVLSGLPCHEFCFLGFFPSKPAKQKALVERLAGLSMTSVFFEAPSRIQHSLDSLALHLPQTPMAVCREMTKLHQEVLCGTAAEIGAALKTVKGEMVLVIGPVEVARTQASLESEYRELLDAGNSPSQSVKLLAKRYRLPKRQLYDQLGRGDSESSEPVS